jgi:hypothetical protein
MEGKAIHNPFTLISQLQAGVPSRGVRLNYFPPARRFYIRVYDQDNVTLLLTSGDPTNPENIVPLPILATKGRMFESRRETVAILGVWRNLD